MRATARALARSAARASKYPNLAAPAEPAPTQLAQGIAGARTADCRDKYAGLGLLGLPFLLKDSVTGKGCVW